MQYPYYILRKVKRAIFWFFEEETEKIYFTHWSEIEQELQEGDIIFALDQYCDSYQQVDNVEEAILTHRGEDEMKIYIKAKYQLDNYLKMKKGYEGCNEWYY
jgi:hypothetical protein